MQTLIDPYELAVSPVPVSERAVPSRVLAAALEAQAERESAPPPLPPSPDSSGRLRCWCSED